MTLLTMKMSHTSRTRHSAVTMPTKTICYFSIKARSIAYCILSCLAFVLPLSCLCLRFALPSYVTYMYVECRGEKNFSCLLLCRPFTRLLRQAPALSCCRRNGNADAVMASWGCWMKNRATRAVTSVVSCWLASLGLNV